MYASSIRRIAIVILLVMLLIQLLPNHSHAQGNGTSATLGGRLLFASDRDGDYEIFTMNPDGTDIRQLTANINKDDLDPTWSPSGTQILFVSNRDQIRGDLYVMDIDGQNVHRLFVNNGVRPNCPSWSPDEQSIVFLDYQSATRQDIVIVEINDVTVVGDENSGNSDSNAEDGEDVEDETSGDAQNAEDETPGDAQDAEDKSDFTVGDPRVLYSSVSGLGCPKWSPDGQQILFASLGTNWEIYVIGVGGTPLIQLTDNSNNDTMPSWSPDGQYIAFVSDQDGSPEIYIMDAQGLEAHQVTVGENDALCPAWSPNGQYLTYRADRGRRNFLYQLYTTRIDGTEVVQLIKNDADESCPAWSPWEGDIEDIEASLPLEIGAIHISDRELVSVVDSQEITLPNCLGSEALSLTRTFSRESERYITFGESQEENFGAYLEWDWQLTSSMKLHAEAGARREIAEYYGFEEGEVISESTEVRLVAAPGTTVTYTLDWTLVNKVGVIEVTRGDETVFVPFQIAETLELVIHDPYQTECSSND